MKSGVDAHIADRGMSRLFRGRGMCHCLWITIAMSFAFQCLLAGEFGSDSAVSPDTATYVALAAELQGFLQGKTTAIGDFVRTPGYPMIILALAKGGGIDVNDVILPVRDWAGANEDGRRLVRRIFIFQQASGFLIPIFLFVIAWLLTGSPYWGLLGSCVYYLDVSSVCYQFTVLSETASNVAILATFAALLAALRWPSRRWAAVLGASVAWAILLKPAFLLLAPLALAAVAFGPVPPRAKRGVIVTILMGVMCAPPVVWTMCNMHRYGHPFYTMNQTITLQNFTGPRFVEIPLPPGDLRTLQENSRAALAISPHFAMSRFIWTTADQLGIKDPFTMWRLMDEANRVTIRKYRGAFLAGGWSRFLATWNDGFVDVGNRYVQLRLEELFAVEPGLFRDSRLLFRSGSLWAFVLLGIAAFLVSRRRETRVGILFGTVAALLYLYLTALFDEMEYLRHGMAARAVINVLLVAELGIIFESARMAARRIGSRAGLRSANRQAFPGKAGHISDFASPTTAACHSTDTSSWRRPRSKYRPPRALSVHRWQ